MQVNLDDNYCGLPGTENNLNSPLDGKIPLEANASIVIRDVNLTSLAATTVDSHTVLFAGTSNGHIRMVS